jgi:predicted  nucleic acid-binding Zn-ribbon protein
MFWLFLLQRDTAQLKTQNDSSVVANQTLEAEIKALEGEISTLETEIKQMDDLLNSSKKLTRKQAKELEELRDKIAGYIKKIEQISQQTKLQPEIQKKVDEYQKLLESYNNTYSERILIETADRDVLEKNITPEYIKQENRILRSRIDSINRVLANVKAENESMRIQLQTARLLSVSDFSYVAINRLGKALDLDDTRGKRIRTLQVRFVINQNPVTSPVEKDIFVLIKEPSGQIYSVPGTTSGYFTLNGQKTLYSGKKTIRYDGNRQKVSIDHTIPENTPLKSGKYVVNVYTTYDNSETAYLLGQHAFYVK